MTMRITDSPTLTDELAAISEDTGWHAFRSDSGDMYAVRALTRAEMHQIEAVWRMSHPTPFTGTALLSGSGVTVHAPTPQLLRYKIARTAREMGLAA